MTERKRKILVVDDDPHMVRILRESLTAPDRRILEATSGLEAIKSALRELPDLIVLDVMMPRLDGYQVCRFIKSVPALRRTRIICLTVKQGVGDRQRGLLQGADDYLNKPFAVEDLEDKVRGHFDGEGDLRTGELSYPPGMGMPKPEEITDEVVVTLMNRILDETVHRFALLEKISKRLLAASAAGEILRTMLAGIVSPVGMGWDRILLMMVDEEEGLLRAETAFALFERPEEGLKHWEELVEAVRDMTMEELFDRKLADFSFQSRDDDPWLGGLRLKVDTAKLAAPAGSVTLGVDALVRASKGRKLDSFMRSIFQNQRVSLVPIAGREKIFGLIVVDRYFSHGGVPIEDVEHLGFLCRQTGLALERQALHRHAQLRAEENERLSILHESIMSGIDLGIAFVDEEGRIGKWNKAMAHFTGLGEEEVVGKSFFDLFPRLRGTLIEERFNITCTSHSPQRVGHFNFSFGKRKMGFFDVRFGVVRRESRGPGTVMIWEDVRLRVTLERKAQEALQHLTNLVEYSADAILTMDTRGRIKSWNRGAEEIFGYEESEIAGKSISRLYEKDNRQEAGVLLDRTDREGKVVNLLETYLHKGGEPVDVSITTSIIKSDGARKSEIVAIIRDVSKRRQMESQLFQTEKLASLGIMAAGMAHEINNPLTSIMMYSQIIGMGQDLGKEERDCIEKIEEDAGRIADIVNSLLVFSRPASRKPERVDVLDTLEKALAFVRYPSGVKKIRIESDYGEDLPPLRGVKTEVQEIFLNLLINARDAIVKEGEINVSCRYRHPGSEVPAGFAGDISCGHVVVSVKDSGMGISREDQKKIYDPFYTTKPPGKGTGLGLAVVHRLVEKHQGCIIVRSRPGEGTTFTVFLPVR